MNRYGYVLLALICFIVLWDYARLRRNGSRVIALEIFVFGCGALTIAIPTISQTLAAWGGVGRGVDAIIYILLVWLVRESIMTRQRRWEESRKFTSLVRAVAVRDAKQFSDRPQSV